MTKVIAVCFFSYRKFFRISYKRKDKDAHLHERYDVAKATALGAAKCSRPS